MLKIKSFTEIGSIKLNMSQFEIVDLLGLPNRIFKNSTSCFEYYFNDYIIGFDNDLKVKEITRYLNNVCSIEINSCIIDVNENLINEIKELDDFFSKIQDYYLFMKIGVLISGFDNDENCEKAITIIK